MNSDVFTYLVIETSLFDKDFAFFLKHIVPIVLLFLLPFFIKTRELCIGSIHFAATYSSLLLIVLASSFGYTIYYKYINLYEYVNEMYCFVISLILLLINIVLTITYPLLAVSIVKLNRKGIVQPVNTSTSEIRLEPGDIIRVKIYGDHSSIGIRSVPENSVKISNFSKTLFYKYLDIYPLSSFGGYIELFYKDREFYRFKCLYTSIEYVRMKFNIYFNDDYIDTYELSIESHKNVSESFEPLLDSITSKIGISRSDISNIVFYTKDRIHIPRETIVADLTSVDEVDVMVYSTEKYMEVFKYYSKSDIYELWEILVKRLEFLRKEMDSLLKEIEDYASKAKLLHSNWW